MAIPVEEFSQIKAITKARKINHDIAPNIYLDMPSITCKNRMQRSPNGKVFLFSGKIETKFDESFKKYINNIQLKWIFNSFRTNEFLVLCNKLNEMWG